MAVIQRFEPEALAASLEKFAYGRGTLYGEEVKFEFNLKTVEDKTAYKLTSKGKDRSSQVTIEMDPIVWEAKNVKPILNEFIKGHNFQSSKEVMRNAERMISVLVDKGALTLTTRNKETGNFDEVVPISKIENFPWGLMKDRYDQAVKDRDIDFLKEVDRAAASIKNFIINELGAGASNELKKAIKWTWMKNFVSYENNPALFFSGGKTSHFISGVQGALGEFQAALIFTFLHEALGANAKYAEIIGNIYKRGTSEQLKTDVQVAEGIGLQVKNINVIQQAEKKTLLRDLETNIHPNKLAPLMKNGQDFLDFITNYYFNLTFQKETKQAFDAMIKMLGSYLGEVMNMAIAEDNDDRVSFYVIAGKYLVPASAILEASEELELAKNLEVTSSYRPFRDEAFEMPLHINSKGKRSPWYVEYWTHPYGDQSSWRPTGKNIQEYNYLASSRISIRTHFNLLQDIERYALFQVKV